MQTCYVCYLKDRIAESIEAEAVPYQVAWVDVSSSLFPLRYSFVLLRFECLPLLWEVMCRKQWGTDSRKLRHRSVSCQLVKGERLWSHRILSYRLRLWGVWHPCSSFAFCALLLSHHRRSRSTFVMLKQHNSQYIQFSVNTNIQWLRGCPQPKLKKRFYKKKPSKPVNLKKRLINKWTRS